MNKLQRRRRLVRIKHSTLGWVKDIVAGYVDQPYARFTLNESKAPWWPWWQANRFVNKWLPEEARPLYTFEERPAELST